MEKRFVLYIDEDDDDERMRSYLGLVADGIESVEEHSTVRQELRDAAETYEAELTFTLVDSVSVYAEIFGLPWIGVERLENRYGWTWKAG